MKIVLRNRTALKKDSKMLACDKRDGAITYVSPVNVNVFWSFTERFV